MFDVKMYKMKICGASIFTWNFMTRPTLTKPRQESRRSPSACGPGHLQGETSPESNSQSAASPSPRIELQKGRASPELNMENHRCSRVLPDKILDILGATSISVQSLKRVLQVQLCKPFNSCEWPKCQ